MMYDSILLPVDSGDGIGAAVEQAVGLARENGATLHVLYVIDRSKGESGLIGSGRTRTALQEEGERVTSDVAACCRQYGITVVTHVEDGDPHRVIVSIADEVNTDLVVMGSHRRGGVKRFLHGSVTERVSRNLSRPVLIVDHEGDLPANDGEPEAAEG